MIDWMNVKLCYVMNVKLEMEPPNLYEMAPIQSSMTPKVVGVFDLTMN